MQLLLIRKYFIIVILAFISSQNHAANKLTPTGIIENKACIQCHEKTIPN